MVDSRRVRARRASRDPARPGRRREEGRHPRHPGLRRVDPHRRGRGRAVGAELGQIVKSLVFVAPGDDGTTDLEPILCLVSGPNRVDLARLAAVTGENDVRRATAREANELTGFVIGGIPPIGHSRPLRVVMDPDLGRFPWSGPPPAPRPPSSRSRRRRCGRSPTRPSPRSPRLSGRAPPGPPARGRGPLHLSPTPTRCAVGPRRDPTRPGPGPDSRAPRRPRTMAEPRNAAVDYPGGSAPLPLGRQRRRVG